MTRPFDLLTLAALHGLRQDQVHRLCALLVLHLDLDRLLSLRLYLALKGNLRDEIPVPSGKEFDDIARLNSDARLNLAKMADVLDDGQAGVIATLNGTRNQFLHIKAGRNPYDHPAITNDREFYQAYDNAERVRRELFEPIRELLYGPRGGDAPEPSASGDKAPKGKLGHSPGTRRRGRPGRDTVRRSRSRGDD